MVQLMKASEVAELTKSNAVEFEQTVIKSKEFKSLVNVIEAAAMRGRYEVNISSIGFGGSSYVQVFKKYLKEAGYKVSTHPNAIVVSWSEVD